MKNTQFVRAAILKIKNTARKPTEEEYNEDSVRNDNDAIAEWTAKREKMVEYGPRRRICIWIRLLIRHVNSTWGRYLRGIEFIEAIFSDSISFKTEWYCCIILHNAHSCAVWLFKRLVEAENMLHRQGSLNLW